MPGARAVRRPALRAIAVAILLVALLQAAPSQTTATERVRVPTSHANVHMGPNTTTQVLVLVARGKPAEVVDHGNGDETWIYRNGGSSALGSGILSGTTVTIGGGGSGYPGNGYPGSGYPGNGYPGSGYPGGGYPGSGYPSSGVGIYVPPIVLSGGGGGGNESVDDDEIVFKQGIVTHGDSPGG